ncbi:uncharacterized protein LOC134191656 [Corticium candelabrum]|uniref:uncharacterized protein LOC134191656 n=1 Tax=Corticium candelabrum TaxID=121492 RepID=UPI002E26D2D9|nr:uncharacterized protein LOC134191656 [Corticium candelabrum]
MERAAAGIMGCSASVSANANSIVSDDVSKQNGHSLTHDSTVAPASTPEPETVEVDGVQRRVSDSHLFQRIKSDIERADEFTRRPLQLDNGEPFLPTSHVPRSPAVTASDLLPSDSQTDFFQMLDKKIAEGPDYCSDGSQS